MPTIENFGPWRFFFYSADNAEPPHVHVRRDSSEAKFWLLPSVRLEFNRGFPSAELNKIEQHVVSNAVLYVEAWYDFFHLE